MIGVICMILDPDILKSEISILKEKEEELVLELEEVRASIGSYQNKIYTTEELL